VQGRGGGGVGGGSGRTAGCSGRTAGVSVGVGVREERGRAYLVSSWSGAEVRQRRPAAERWRRPAAKFGSLTA